MHEKTTDGITADAETTEQRLLAGIRGALERAELAHRQMQDEERASDQTIDTEAAADGAGLRMARALKDITRLAQAARERIVPEQVLRTEAVERNWAERIAEGSGGPRLG
jgi:hypothetical protein